MTGRLYCIDNDVLKKLATFDLFDDTIALFDAGPNDISILKTAQYKFRADWQKVQKGRCRTPEALAVNYERTLALAKKLPHIVEANIDYALVEHLLTFEDIQRGEAILTACVAQFLEKENTPDAFILTGDKRYLRALSLIDRVGFQEKFSHRFWCFEQLILRDVRTYGLESMRKQVVPRRECDTAMKVAFGSGQRSTQKNAVAALIGYIADLRKDTGELLHPYAG